MDLANMECKDGTITVANRVASTCLPPPTKKMSTPTKKEAFIILSASTKREFGTTPKISTNTNTMCTSNPAQSATPSSKCTSSNDNVTDNPNHVSSFHKWLGHDQDCKPIIVNDMKILVHHLRIIEAKAVRTFQHAVNKDSEWFAESWE
jgi:hypothetical protein